MTDSSGLKQVKLSAANPIILLDFLREQGLNQHQIFSSTTINPDLFSSTDNQLSMDEYRQLIQRAIDLTKNPSLGLEFGQRLSFTGHSNLGFGAMASPTFWDLLLFARRCAPVINPATEFVVSEDGDRVHLKLCEAYPWENTEVFMVDTAFSMFTVAVKMFDASVVEQLSYRFRHSSQGREALYEQFLQGDTSFDESENVISFPAGFCHKPLSLYNPSAVKQAESLLQNQLEKLGNTYYEMQGVVKEMIIANPGVSPTLEEAAKAFHVSPRTLNRRFKAVGTQFKDVVHEVKKQMAIEYLATGKLSIEEMSYRLGYSDPSNFSKAFKSWTGYTPSQYSPKK